MGEWLTTPETWLYLKPAARQMRHAPTPEEAVLWEQLQGGQIRGLRFRRQHPVGKYIVDFYCPATRLVIEVDGPVHDSRHAEDANRQSYLESLGLRALRFTNEEVHRSLPQVVARIAKAVTSPQPLSATERG